MGSESKSMLENSQSNFNHSQSIKAALHLTIGQISKSVGSEYGLTFSKPAVATLAELINRQIEVYAIDLEAFAKHARRTLINVDDVKLLGRRNKKWKESINGCIDEVEASGSSIPKKVKRRKKEVKTKAKKVDKEITVEEDKAKEKDDSKTEKIENLDIIEID